MMISNPGLGIVYFIALNLAMFGVVGYLRHVRRGRERDARMNLAIGNWVRNNKEGE